MIVIHTEPGFTPEQVDRRIVRRIANGAAYLWSDLSAGGRLLRKGRCYGSELPSEVKRNADSQRVWPGFVDWPQETKNPL